MRGLWSLYGKVKEAILVPLPRAQENVSGIIDTVAPWLLGKTSKVLPRRKDRTGILELGFKTSKG